MAYNNATCITINIAKQPPNAGRVSNRLKTDYDQWLALKLITTNGSREKSQRALKLLMMENYFHLQMLTLSPKL